MLRQNLKIIGNRETHPLTWLPKLNYIALKLHCQKQWPKKLPKNIGPKKKLHLQVSYYKDSICNFKKIGDATLPNNFKIVLSIHNNNK